MKTTYSAGFDVHKKTIRIAVMNEDGKQVVDETIESRREAILAWLAKNDHLQGLCVALEASGSSAWVTYLLMAEGIAVIPVHPRGVRAIAETKQKSDRLDARKLAELNRLGVLRPIHVPDEDTRATRALLRQMRRLVNARTRAKNTVTNVLTELGEVAPCTDLFGKRGRQWLRRLELAPEYLVIVEQELEQIDLLAKLLKDLDKSLESALRESALYELLRTIPGVGPRLGGAIALEFGDVRRFKTAKAAACYTGLIPSTYQSGERRRAGRITKEGNSTLRWALVQATMQLIRLDPGTKKRYVRLRNRLKRNRARVAIAHKLAIAIWHMARTGEAYRIEDPPPSKARKTPPRARAQAT